MTHAFCQVSVSPMRAEPSDKSEMVSQLLFGELIEILEKKENWLHICTEYDNYVGWIDYKQVSLLSDEQHKILQQNVQYSKDIIDYLEFEQLPFHISIGSELRNFYNQNLDLFSKKFTFNGETISGQFPKENLIRIATTYINTPYLWGGKSSFGIDCSGFTQQVYKLCGYKLPRDAYQQAELGQVLSFVEEAVGGDLAFFENSEGKIIHVGILFDNNTIIHAHGKVRIDLLDNYGIFNSELGKHTHKLRFIRKIV